MPVLASVNVKRAVPRKIAPSKVVIIGSGQLTSDDHDFVMANLAAARLPHGSRLGKMKERHHAIARLAITGADTKTIAAQIGEGITEAAVGHILKAPATKALIQDLRKQADQEAIDFAGAMTRTMSKALGVIDAAVSKPDADHRFAHDVMKDLADRAGYPAQKTVHSLNLSGKVPDDPNFATKLNEIRTQSRARVREKGAAEISETATDGLVTEGARGAAPHTEPAGHLEHALSNTEWAEVPEEGGAGAGAD